MTDMACGPNDLVIGGLWAYVFVGLFFALGYIFGAASGKRRGQDVAERLARLSALKEQYVTPPFVRAIKQRLREFHNTNRVTPRLPIYVQPAEAYLLIKDTTHIGMLAGTIRDAEDVFREWLTSDETNVAFFMFGHPVLPLKEHH